MHRLLANLLLILLLSSAVLVSCSPKQGYPGPELPEAETARIYFAPEFDGPNQGVSLSSMQVDRVPIGMFDAGIRVIPGKHNVHFNYYYSWSPCDDADSHVFCSPETSSGQCNFELDTSPGKTYRVEVQGSFRGAKIWVIDDEPYKPILSEQCKSSF